MRTKPNQVLAGLDQPSEAERMDLSSCRLHPLKSKMKIPTPPKRDGWVSSMLTGSGSYFLLLLYGGGCTAVCWSVRVFM